jgi:hypothetical protein
MKTFGKLLVLIGIGIPIIAILNCYGWDYWPTLSQKIKFSFIEIVPETTRPDIVHLDKVGYSNTLAAIESSAFEAYPHVEKITSTCTAGPLRCLDFDLSYDVKRHGAFISGKID